MPHEVILLKVCESAVKADPRQPLSLEICPGIPFNKASEGIVMSLCRLSLIYTEWR